MEQSVIDSKMRQEEGSRWQEGGEGGKLAEEVLVENDAQKR